MIPVPTNQAASRRLGAARAENHNGASRRRGVRRFAYDENGSMLREYDQAAGTTTYYAYADNGLASRIKPPAGSSTYFHYDARMQRFAIDFGVTLAYFSWDGLNQLEERKSDLSLETQHTHGATPIEGIGSMVVTKHVYAPDRFEYPHYDHRGSLFFLEDTVFGYLDMEYTPFGKSFAPGTSVTVSQRYTYTGREQNPLSSLMYYRWRQYDARLGRFGGRDPIGYLGGPGVYAYVSGRVVVRNDPYGADWCWSGVHRTATATEVEAFEREQVPTVHQARAVLDQPSLSGAFVGFREGQATATAEQAAPEEEMKTFGPAYDNPAGISEAWITVMVDAEVELSKGGKKDTCCVTFLDIDMTVDAYLSDQAGYGAEAHELGHSLDMQRAWEEFYRPLIGETKVYDVWRDESAMRRARNELSHGIGLGFRGYLAGQHLATSEAGRMVQGPTENYTQIIWQRANARSLDDGDFFLEQVERRLQEGSVGGRRTPLYSHPSQWIKVTKEGTCEGP